MVSNPFPPWGLLFSTEGYLELTMNDAFLLSETIDQAIEGHLETKEIVEGDPSIDTPELLVETLNEIDNTIQQLQIMQRRLSVVRYKSPGTSKSL